jgi:hypothetical protein
MRYEILLAAVLTALPANGQTTPPKCYKVADVKPPADPLIPLRPNSATFPCDMVSSGDEDHAVKIPEFSSF